MNTDKPNRKLVKIQDIAEMYNLTESWIRSKIFQREIPFIKLGHLIRFDPVEVDKWLENKRAS